MTPDLPAGTTTLLLDADGNLVPSEEPAFVASADVTNAFLAELGVDRRFTAEQLRLATTGKNFRTTAVDLAVDAGVPKSTAYRVMNALVGRGALRNVGTDDRARYVVTTPPGEP